VRRLLTRLTMSRVVQKLAFEVFDFVIDRVAEYLTAYVLNNKQNNKLKLEQGERDVQLRSQGQSNQEPEIKDSRLRVVTN
jgi:hypothetical protein